MLRPRVTGWPGRDFKRRERTMIGDTMQAVSSPSPAATAAHDFATEAVYRKVTWKLMPLLFVCYVFAYIDRANIGFAHLQFRRDVGLSEAAFGLGVGLFYLGYMLLEVPSNLWLQRIGIRRTLLRIMTIWGVVSVCTAFVRSPMEFYLARLLLGAAEAGFFPGVILYFAHDVVALMVLLCVATAGYLGMHSLFWTIPPAYLKPAVAASGIGLISSLGQFGGIFAPTVIGLAASRFGSNAMGLYAVALVSILGGLAIVLGVPRRAISER
jgi:hypothetical protein